jgi:hypothetical protein
VGHHGEAEAGACLVRSCCCAEVFVTAACIGAFREEEEKEEREKKTKGRKREAKKNMENFPNLKIFLGKNKRQFMMLVKIILKKERYMPNYK